MAVKIGSARHDENGRYSGGKAGDQTGSEVSTQDWYKHSKGWVCIRAKDDKVREKIAVAMQAACNNPHIGYDQSQNTTLFAVASKVGYDPAKVTVNCETDCARLVRVCVWYAGIKADDFYTGNEVEALRETGAFNILTDDDYTTKSSYLKRGDILVTKTKGHTVVVLSNGSKVKTDSNTSVNEDINNDSLRRGSKGSKVEELQTALKKLDYKDANGNTLDIDGSFGSKTEYAVKAFQKDHNLVVDGIFGPITKAALEKALKESSPTKTVKATTSVYIRKGPSKSYSHIKVLKKGKTAIWDGEEKNGWYHLPNEGGWVSSKYLKVI